MVTPKRRIQTVETRKRARFHRSDVTFINEKLECFSTKKKAGDFWDSGILWFISEGNTWNKYYYTSLGKDAGSPLSM